LHLNKNRLGNILEISFVILHNYFSTQSTMGFDHFHTFSGSFVGPAQQKCMLSLHNIFTIAPVSISHYRWFHLRCFLCLGRDRSHVELS